MLQPQGETLPDFCSTPPLTETKAAKTEKDPPDLVWGSPPKAQWIPCERVTTSQTAIKIPPTGPDGDDKGFFETCASSNRDKDSTGTEILFSETPMS